MDMVTQSQRCQTVVPNLLDHYLSKRNEILREPYDSFYRLADTLSLLVSQLQVLKFNVPNIVCLTQFY